jgi:hypothetical protein
VVRLAQSEIVFTGRIIDPMVPRTHKMGLLLLR